MKNKIIEKLHDIDCLNIENNIKRFLYYKIIHYRLMRYYGFFFPLLDISNFDDIFLIEKFYLIKWGFEEASKQITVNGFFYMRKIIILTSLKSKIKSSSNLSSLDNYFFDKDYKKKFDTIDINTYLSYGMECRYNKYIGRFLQHTNEEIYEALENIKDQKEEEMIDNKNQYTDDEKNIDFISAFY